MKITVKQLRSLIKESKSLLIEGQFDVAKVNFTIPIDERQKIKFLKIEWRVPQFSGDDVTLRLYFDRKTWNNNDYEDRVLYNEDFGYALKKALLKLANEGVLPKNRKYPWGKVLVDDVPMQGDNYIYATLF